MDYQCFINDDRRDDLLTKGEKQFLVDELRPDGRFEEAEIEGWMVPIIESLLKKKGFVVLEKDEHGKIHLFCIGCPKDINGCDYGLPLFNELKKRVKEYNN